MDEYNTIRLAMNAEERRHTAVVERYRAREASDADFLASREYHKRCEAVYDFAYFATACGIQHSMFHYGPSVANFGAVVTF
jgi:hypothetical protein